MCQKAVGRWMTQRFASVVCGVALSWLGAIEVLGQDYPRLPGAVTKAPDWIETDAPFDVARFFVAVPRDQNAAPLYLDALFEFGSEVAACFPEGAERERRRLAAESRMSRYVPLSQRLRGDPQSIPPEEIDSVIKEYDVGFRKLAEAQQRARCVFETGPGAGAPIFHLQTARQVARVASLRVQRATQKHEFDAAIHEIDTVLRLVRDLQPRGCMINQLVAAAITQVICVDMVGMILAAPDLRVEHCDRMLKLFLGHEAKSIDAYAEGLRAEYLVNRVELRKTIQKLPHLDAGTSPTPLSRAVRDLNVYYRKLLGMDGLTYADRLAKIAATKVSDRADPLGAMINMLGPAMVPFSQAMGRTTASLHATECLIILRRWELSHRGLPRALTVAVKEAGLKAIPTDPYDSKPLRLAVLEGQPVIYSVGKDGQDDGARKDSKYDTQPGDLIYRLRPVEAHR